MLLEGIEAAHVSKILNESANIMTRFGKHCVHSWFNKRRLPDSLRVSFSACHTVADADAFAEALADILRHFRRKRAGHPQPC